MLNKLILLTILFLININAANADENITIIASTTDAANGLNLHAVSEIFKDTKNLEDFERAINDPDDGVNNIDLDGDGYVDYIRVVEEVVNHSHVIILQAVLGDNEFQDVAIIEIEKSGTDYNMHVHGHELIYGANYYIAPSHVYIHTWPIIAWIYRPIYNPYHSVYNWSYHPRWWKPFRPLRTSVYHSRVNRFTKRNTFIVTRKARVKTITRVKYKPKTSVHVSKNIRYKKSNKTTNIRVNKTTNNRNGKATVTKNVTRKTSNKAGHKTTIKKNNKNTTTQKTKKKTNKKKVKNKK